jgi:hypothetical protein
MLCIGTRVRRVLYQRSRSLPTPDFAHSQPTCCFSKVLSFVRLDGRGLEDVNEEHDFDYGFFIGLGPQYLYQVQLEIWSFL